MSDVRFSFYPIADSYLLVALASAVLLGLLLIGPARGRVSLGRRLVLIGLRLVLVLAVILAMLRPTMLYTHTTKQAATLVVLTDQSRSMSTPDEPDGKTRWQAQRRALEDARTALRDLAGEFEVKAYAFDAEAHALDVESGRLPLPEEPEGRQTALGAVLEDVLRQQAGKRLLGVILLSDGAQRAYPPRDLLPQVAANQYRYLGYPLYTFRFGQARGVGQLRDVSVKELLATDRVFVKNELTVSGQVRADGYVNREVPVQLEYETAPGKMEVVGQERLRVTADGQVLPVQFTYIPETPGEHKLTLKVVDQPGDWVSTNNQMSTFVNVLKGGLKVLYLEGTVRPETTFLRRSLDTSEDINVELSRMDARKPQTRHAELGEWLKPGKYDVYILGDLDAQAFEGRELETLSQTVAQGAGLIMLGGIHSFGAGGYAKTAMADVLPIRMDNMERQSFLDPVAGDLHWPGPLAMRPRLEVNRFMLNLGGSLEESRQIWSRLPPLKDGANRFRGLKPGALVLAEGAKDQPLLVSHQFGNGRVLAFAGDSTWRWVTHGFEGAHKRFWRQVILWLARKDESLEGNVWVKPETRRLSPNQPLRFSVGAQGADGELLRDATFQAEVRLPDRSVRAVQIVRGQDVASGSFRDTLAPGDYTIRVVASHGGKEVGTAQARFLVVEEDLERDNAMADSSLLETLARMTGGESLAPEELPALIRRLGLNRADLEVQTETKETLWDSWPFFLVMVGVLVLEWFLRKRWALV